MFWTTSDGLLEMAIADEEWNGGEKSVSASNDMLRTLLTGLLRSQYAGRPDLIEKIIPNYPPGAKRILLDNGSWARALQRENVELVTERIESIVPEGVLTVDGTLHEADVIVYGTGFQASRFLTPMKISGRNGAELSKQWESEARAYLGITVPNFPNLFLLYGPNTNLVVNGSIIYISECQVQYILECLRLLLEDGYRALDCKQDVHDAYNERIDAANGERAWGVSSVNSWYKNERGHVTQNWPFNLVEYWKQTREPDPADYVFL
jgi:4-hydroxyacetophenone monooxygenase